MSETPTLPPKLAAVLRRLNKGRNLTPGQLVVLPYLVDVVAMRVLGRRITEAEHVTVSDDEWRAVVDAEERQPRIVVAPGYSWTRPFVARRQISTAVLHSRTAAGETREHLAEDYDLTLEEVDAALAFERWCRRRGRYDAPYAERLARTNPDAGGWPRQVWPRSAP